MIEQAQENKVTVELKPHAALKLIHAVGEAWWMVGGPHEKDSRLTLRLEIDGLACDTNPTITLMADGTWSMTTDLCIDNL